MAGFELQPLQHREAIAYFRSKGYAPVLQRFHHLDHFREEHARNWVVAKAMREDVSQAIRDAVDRQLSEGIPIDQAIRDLAPELQRLGWWGKARMTDPLTGEEELVQLGSMRRLRTIFDTNMRTAHAAGHWASIQRTKQSFPYLEYVQIDRPTKRHEHERFHGRIWHVDDPIWLRIYPPNGWFCGCHVIQRTEGWMRRNSRTPDEQLDLEEQPWTNKRSGEIVDVPRGIHPGFDTNPGAVWLDIDQGWREAAPDLPAEQRAQERGALEAMRLLQISQGREVLTIVDRDAGPIAFRRATPEQRDFITLDGLPVTGRTSILHSHPTDTPLSFPDVDALLKSGAASITAVTPAGAIWRARPQSGATPDLRSIWWPFQQQAFLSGIYPDLKALPDDEAAIVYYHAMMLWLEKSGIVTYSLHAPGRIGQILARNAPLVERLLDVPASQ